jgi:glycerol kinase
MPREFILGIDQGGSGSRAALIDRDGQVRGYGYQRIERLYPQLGWVEQDPLTLARSVRRSISGAMRAAGCGPDSIIACGVTSQRDTVFAWDARSAQPIGNAITWQDLRTAPLVAETERWPHAAERRARLGQFPGAYSSAMHMAWRMRHDAAFREAADAGRLRVSLSAGWIVRALGEPDGHALDYSLLQGMTVFDPRSKAYWDEWIEHLGLPRAALPAPRPTLSHFGDLRLTMGKRRASVPVTALIADQQAALFGYDCRAPGQAAVTHGTASFVNVVAGPLAPPQGICKTYLAWEIGGVPTYSLEADLTVTGAAVRWMHQVGLLEKSSELGRLAGSVENSAGVIFVPAFTGLGVPSEDRSVRGSLLGMTLGTTKAHLARAFFEAIGYQMREVIAQIEHDAGVKISELRVGGGLAASNEGCQIQADVLGIPLIRAHDTETGVRAAALLAGLGAGVWPDANALPPLLDERAAVFTPRSSADERDSGLARWQAAVNRLRDWPV